LKSYWSRFDNIDHLLDDDSDSDEEVDMDYNSGDQEDEDVEMLEEVHQSKPSQAPKATEQAR
jgi:hypothetical protein